MTFTGAIGALCMFPLRAIIRLCVALRIHPNTLTLIGYLINVAAAFALGYGHFTWAGVIIVIANIFDMIDGKVAHELRQLERRLAVEEAPEELHHRGGVHDDALRGERDRHHDRDHEDQDDEHRRKPRAPAQPIAQRDEDRPRREAEDPREKDRAEEGLQHEEAADDEQRDRCEAGVLLEPARRHGVSGKGRGRQARILADRAFDTK
jgi:hypothetical protein